MAYSVTFSTPPPSSFSHINVFVEFQNNVWWHQQCSKRRRVFFYDSKTIWCIPFSGIKWLVYVCTMYYADGICCTLVQDWFSRGLRKTIAVTRHNSLRSHQVKLVLNLLTLGLKPTTLAPFIQFMLMVVSICSGVTKHLTWSGDTFFVF